MEIKGQKPSKLSILAKNGQILATKGQILAISEFSQQIHYDFLKEDHKGSFHTKNYEIFYRCLEDIGQNTKKMAILAKNGQILTIFGHFEGQIFFDRKIFGGHLSHMETQLHAKNQKKKSNGQGCRAGTDVRTYVRTHVRT